MKWTFGDCKELTLTEYLWIYDSYCMTNWDHTAQLSSLLHGLQATVVNALTGKGKIKPKEPAYFNPYRASDIPKENRITPANFKTLKFIGHSMVQGK